MTDQLSTAGFHDDQEQLLAHAAAAHLLGDARHVRYVRGVRLTGTLSLVGATPTGKVAVTGAAAGVLTFAADGSVSGFLDGRRVDSPGPGAGVRAQRLAVQPGSGQVARDVVRRAQRLRRLLRSTRTGER